jgi:dTDP-4-dehydrorhamnose 3,5-epimerase-like enzyme
MAKIIQLKTLSGERGRLTVMDNIQTLLPFAVKRIFYIYDVDASDRGGHRHKKTLQAAICIKGSCVVVSNNGIHQEQFLLDTPDKCLILYPEDWHIMKEFSKDALFLVFASECYDPNDYIFEPYSS